MPLWNDESVKRLLLAVITVTGAATHDWDQVVQLMGGDYSKEGCRYVLSRFFVGSIVLCRIIYHGHD